MLHGRSNTLLAANFLGKIQRTGRKLLTVPENRQKVAHRKVTPEPNLATNTTVVFRGLKTPKNV